MINLRFDPPRLRRIMVAGRLSQARLARLLAVPEQTVYRWMQTGVQRASHRVYERLLELEAALAIDKAPVTETVLRCQSCGYEWVPRVALPRRCPKCFSLRYEKRERRV